MNFDLGGSELTPGVVATMMTVARSRKARCPECDKSQIAALFRFCHKCYRPHCGCHDFDKCDGQPKDSEIAAIGYKQAL